MDTTGTHPLQPQLLRMPYHSTPTHDEREYLLYLPAAYGPANAKL
jgi:hypothetical protein